MSFRLPSIFRTPEQKKRKFTPKPPVYRDRHAEKDFLILATGPSLKSHEATILKFRQENELVVVGCNRIPEAFQLDYRIFVNRRRFADYAGIGHADSKLLLSPEFQPSLIKEIVGDRPYEEVMFENQYPSQQGSLTLREGIVSAQGATVAPIACGVAIAMGAQNIFVAGMDGYTQNEASHYYEESDDKTRDELVEKEKPTLQILHDVSRLLNGRLQIITPTAYHEFQA